MTTLLSFLVKRRSVLMGILGLPIAASVQAAPSAEKPMYERPFGGFRGTSVEQKIQELADREEIKELVSRYALRVAQGITVADLFTDDGAFISRVPGRPLAESRGRAALEKAFTAIPVAGNSLPMIHNQLIEVAGNEATGVCSLELRSSANGKSLIGSGFYEDRFRKENGRWKFAVRDVRLFHLVPIQDGWTSAPKPG